MFPDVESAHRACQEEAACIPGLQRIFLTRSEEL